MKKTYKKNQSLAKANKSLRLQLHQASKKTLSQKSKHEVVREIMSPFFTQTQIDCFCRPSWLRSRNWGDQDFELGMFLNYYYLLVPLKFMLGTEVEFISPQKGANGYNL